MQWLIGKEDRYTASWKRWVGLTGPLSSVSPRHPGQRSGLPHWTPRRRVLEKELGGRLAPTQSDQDCRRRYVSTHLPGLVTVAAGNPRSATRKPTTGEVVEITANLDAIEAPPPLPQEIRTFWGVFSWADNPWIPDGTAPYLATSKFDGIQSMSIKDLQIQRIGETTYAMRNPPIPAGALGHTIAKIERWALAIILSSPRIKVGERIGQAPPISLRRSPALRQSYKWQVAETTSTVIGWAKGGKATIQLEQQDDGIHWTVTGHRNARKDAKRLQKCPG
eukprot:jgi/Phyca11/131835/e_gw1.118.35.1